MKRCKPRRMVEMPKIFSRFRTLRCDKCEHYGEIEVCTPGWMTEMPTLFYRGRTTQCYECLLYGAKMYWYKVYKNYDHPLVGGSSHHWICIHCGERIFRDGSNRYTGFKGRKRKSVPMSLINRNARKKKETVDSWESKQDSELGLDFYQQGE